MTPRKDAQPATDSPAMSPTPTLSVMAVIGLAVVSAVALGFCFAPFDIVPLAFVALVPWTVAMLRGRRGWATLLVGWLSGWAFWAGWLYWLLLPTGVGYVSATGYFSLYWLASAALLRAAGRRRWPMWIVLPVVWVGFEMIRSRLMSGFTWFFLAQSQYRWTALIQIADVAGAYGVSFLVAMVNGLCVDAILSPGRRRRLILPACLTAVLAGGMLTYGLFRLSQQTTQPGPRIGLVQEAYPISLHGMLVPSQQFLDGHIVQTWKAFGLASPKPDLIVWPETVLPPGVNRAFIGLRVADLDDAAVGQLLSLIIGPEQAATCGRDEARTILRYFVGDAPEDRLLASAGGRLADVLNEAARQGLAPPLPKRLDELIPAMKSIRPERALKVMRRCAGAQALMVQMTSALVGTPILAGATTYQPNPHPTNAADGWVLTNSVLLFGPGGQFDAEYAKVHLVPFSEYVPWKYDWPAGHRLLRQFVPEAMPQIEPGEAFTRFTLSTDRGEFVILTPICFENTFARVCRDMVNSGPKDRAVLVNVSNDGWFVHPPGAEGFWRMLSGEAKRSESFVRTTEQAQHLVHSVFRAVENRVPVVRAVNTGITASIDSNGRIAAELVDNKDRNNVSDAGAAPGALEVLVRTDDRITVYSQVGDLFGWATVAALAILTGRLLWTRRRKDSGSV